MRYNRSEFLAYKIYNNLDLQHLNNLTQEELVALVKKESSENYTEGYVKGVHDEDALTLLQQLVQTEVNLGILKYTPKVRAYAQFFWNSLQEEDQQQLNNQIKASGNVLQIFPGADSYQFVIEHLSVAIAQFLEACDVKDIDASRIAHYIFEELCANDSFAVSANAIELKLAFKDYLKANNGLTSFEKSLELLGNLQDRMDLVRQWLNAFISNTSNKDQFYIDEAIALVLFNGTN